MEITIRFEDVNHELIAKHRIQYDTITPPFLVVTGYCEKIRRMYPDVMFYYIEW